ncbi:MAG: hypothetical protein KGY38_06850 [Desulfobacterales bacterium]|nr:hypothetical protein [Desulfobacterales bacterium]
MYALAVNGSPRKDGNTYNMSQMIVPGSTYWNIGMGFNKADVLEDAEGMTNMAHLGAVIDWLGRAVHDYLESYPQP